MNLRIWKKQRYKIEGEKCRVKTVSTDFKHVNSRDFSGMKIQAYLTAFVVNTKRIVKLVTEKQAIFQIGFIGSHTKKWI